MFHETESLDDYRSWLVSFAHHVPGILTRFAVTSRQAEEVSGLGIERQLDRRFTLAIVGRMKAGKSTLVNALLEQKQQLAPVGVTETTATINWFDHGEGDITRWFTIHWKEEQREPERRPLDRLAELSGRSTLAVQVGHLQFHVNSQFLTNVRMVDTPGFGSTVAAHESAVGEFLDEGGRTDAVVIVLNGVPREQDAQALDDFQGRTRFQGQGPYNSLAVLQKWEGLEGGLERAHGIAEDWKRQLSARVADIVPVSGLLYQTCLLVADGDLEKLAALATQTGEAELGELLADEQSFRGDLRGAAIYDAVLGSLCAGRADQSDPWPALRFAARLAARERVTDAGALRMLIRDASGIERLRDELQRRFFKLSGLIQAGSVLRRALALCEEAAQNLRTERARFQEMERQQKGVRERLAQARDLDRELRDSVSALCDGQQSILREALETLERTQMELDTWSREGQRKVGLLLADAEQIEVLENPGAGFDPDTAQSLRRLFGLGGIATWQRLALRADASLLDLSRRADELLEQVRRRLRDCMSVRQRRLLAHARERLQDIHQALADRPDVRP
jgi:hypothetical protein